MIRESFRLKLKESDRKYCYLRDKLKIEVLTIIKLWSELKCMFRFVSRGKAKTNMPES